MHWAGFMYAISHKAYLNSARFHLQCGSPACLLQTACMAALVLVYGLTMWAALQGLTTEMNAIAANLAMNNPLLLHDRWGVSETEGPEAPLRKPLPDDVKQACLHLLVRPICNK